MSDMNRAFTPYFTTKGLDKGTGLGLHAMREIVRQNGGTVDIISEAFKGATIRIKLPLPTNNTTTGEQKA